VPLLDDGDGIWDEYDDERNDEPFARRLEK
jgi:hypothetical protein